MVITEKKGNRAIFLLNRVKIKYVNNVRTLDYMYHKYQVRNAAELSFLSARSMSVPRENGKDSVRAVSGFMRRIRWFCRNFAS